MRILPITILTVFITRLLGLFAIQFFPFIYFDKFYHLYYGLILLTLAIFFTSISKYTRLILLAIGIGLVIDDIAVLKNFITGPPADPISTYWSATYIIPLFFGLLLISFYEERLKSWMK